MFDTLMDMCYHLMRDARGRSILVARSFGCAAPAGDACRFPGDVAGQGCACLWGVATIGQRVAPALAGRRSASAEVEAAGEAAGGPAQGLSGSHGCPPQHRPPPR